MKFAVIALVILAVVVIWRRFFHVARPAIPPLSIAPDDPLMRDAMVKAKETIPHFRELAAAPNRGSRVKVPFMTSSGTTEFLWAEVLSLAESEMEVRYLTPPVAHTGQLQRLRKLPVEDLVDWQIELHSGKYAGGYTMRVMFVRGREQWGSLPPEVEAEEKKYD